MIKIKSDANLKLLQNFSNQSFPDVTIITQTSKYNLTLAYLVIDSEYFNSLSSDVTEINLAHLPEKPLVQVLRALYGDKLIASSVAELQSIYKVIDFLGIQEYKNSIVAQIRKNKDLMENLQILEFCHNYNLITEEVKKFHFENKLRALQNNKNFLQLNKISLKTLIPLLLQFYEQAQGSGASIINNILQNYFNRNNIRASQFFEEYCDVDALLSIWEQFHHILHIERKPKAMGNSMIGSNQQKIGNIMKTSFVNQPKTESEVKKIKQQEKMIAQLRLKIQEQEKVISKLNKQLFSLKSQTGKLNSTRRLPSNPVIPMDGEDEISIIENSKLTKKELVLKNLKSQHTPSSGNESKLPAKMIVNNKINFGEF